MTGAQGDGGTRALPTSTTIGGYTMTEALAPYTKSVLPNGIRLLTASMPATRAVSIAFYVGTGSRFEHEAESGASHFLEHILFKGTERRPLAQDVSETIERVGGFMNASTDREVTVYWARVARPHLSIGIDILSDMLLNSTFPAEEIEKERDVILEEIHTSVDSPAQQVFHMADKIMWPDQPLGRDIAGTEESIREISRDTIMSYMREQYDPSQVVMAVAGQIEHAEIEQVVGELLESWPSGNPRPMPPVDDKQPESRVALEYRKTEQANICLMFPGMSAHDPDRRALWLLNSILGDGMACRLFLELRERLGIVYEVDTDVMYLQDTGAMAVFVGTVPQRGPQALEAVVKELERATRDITQSELDRALELSKGRMLLRLEDTRSISSWLGGQEITFGHIETPEEVVEQLDSITVDDVQRVARRVFDPERFRLTVVGPYRSDRKFRNIIEGR